MRIAARMHADGRLEFGIQRLDDEGTPRLLHLEYERFFPRDVTQVNSSRWLGERASLQRSCFRRRTRLRTKV